MNQDTQDRRKGAVEGRLKSLFEYGLAGNQIAYHAFLWELSGYLRAFLKKHLLDSQDDIEDLIQEVLIAVHRARHTFHSDQLLTIWLYAIVQYKIARLPGVRLRTERFTVPLDERLDIFAARNILHENVRIDSNGLFERFPPCQRLPTLLTKLTEPSATETAKVADQSGSAVKVEICRGVKALAAKFKRVF